MKRIKAWWDRNSKRNQQEKTSHEVSPIICSECGQQKGMMGVHKESDMIKLRNVSGTDYQDIIKSLTSSK